MQKIRASWPFRKGKKSKGKDGSNPPSHLAVLPASHAAVSSGELEIRDQAESQVGSAVAQSARETASDRRAAACFDPEQLWDKAYDDLKREEPEMLQYYETILSRELDSSEGNIIEQDRTMRRSQMDRLLNTGLDKTAKLAAAQKSIVDVITVVLSVKEAIGSALEAVPIASLAWTGLCLVLQLVSNPMAQTTANREGIVHVVQTMKWYSSLSKLLVEVSEHDERFVELRSLLGTRIINLYKELLKYIIKSIRAYYRLAALDFLRGVFRLDDWDGSLDSVSEAEEAVRTAAGEYGVREANSYLGLLLGLHVSQTQNEIMQKLCVADMTAEIESLQKRKDVLLADSYKWIVTNQQYRDFLDWRESNRNRLLWIRGDAGTGKTMLLIGIVNELTAQLESHFDTSHLSYFFCQGTVNKLNTATAILRGLIWMLLRQQKSLICHLDAFKDLGSALFDDRTSFYNLKKVFRSMLQDESLERAYLVVDALDECRKDEPGLKQLLEFICEVSNESAKVKWLVSSRNEPEIEAALEDHTAKTTLSLESNAESVTQAVEAYIVYQMNQLGCRYRQKFPGRRDPKFHEQLRTLLDDIATKIRSNANGTFLWVALAFKEIEDCAPHKAVERISRIPSDLRGVYDQMMHRVLSLEDAEDYKQVLLVMVNAYRPLHVSELASLAGLSPFSYHQDIVRHCGLLTIRKDDDIVYFVHQSAKDFLVDEANSDILSMIFPGGHTEGHRTIAARSLASMSENLRRNVYGLQHPGLPVSAITRPDPGPLTPIRYACLNWIKHLCEANGGHDQASLDDDGPVHVFLKKHFLHWLEALALMRSISDGVIAIAELAKLLTGALSDSQLLRQVQDMHRFILYHRGGIEINPLQAYLSALIFSPTSSLTRQLFKSQEPGWVLTKPVVDAQWSACIQTLEGHRRGVRSVAFSQDGTRIVSGSDDSTVKIWDTERGDCIQTLEGHQAPVMSVVFSQDGIRLASGSDDYTVKVWDTERGDCIQTLGGHQSSVSSVSFSQDGIRLVSGSDDNTIKVWDTDRGDCIQTLDGHQDVVSSVAFSQDSTRIVSGSRDCTVKIWNTDRGDCIQTLDGNQDGVSSVACSQDSTRIVSGSWDNTIKVWDTERGECIQTLVGHQDTVCSVAFSPDGTRIASGSWDSTIKIWNVEHGDCLQTLEVGKPVYRIEFTTSCLLTDLGSLPYAAGIYAPTARTEPVPRAKGHRKSYGVSRESTWITWNGENVLWLPPEYRRGRYATAPWAVALGYRSGRVVILRFSATESCLDGL